MTDLNVVLDALAAGRINAAEATQLIEALKRGEAATGFSESERSASTSANTDHTVAPSQTVDAPAEAVAIEPVIIPAETEIPFDRRRQKGTSRTVETIAIRAISRRVRVVGDWSIATAVVEGPHVVRRLDTVLEITSDNESAPKRKPFSVLRPPKSLADVRKMGLGKELVVRVNPNLIVDAEVTAGALTTQDVPYLGKIRVTAGNARLSGVAKITDALIQAGSANLSGIVRTGHSRVRCESGHLSVVLTEDSDVTVTTAAQLGKVIWKPASGEINECVVGNGAARLDLSVVMGVMTVQIGEIEDIIVEP